jgi:hypothetical protein
MGAAGQKPAAGASEKKAHYPCAGHGDAICDIGRADNALKALLQIGAGHVLGPFLFARAGLESPKPNGVA